MTIEDNKGMIWRLIEDLWNRGQYDTIDDLCHRNALHFDPTSPDGMSNELFRQFVADYRAAFPDLKIEVTAMIAEDDYVVAVWRARGTHRGAFMGIPPTGERVVAEGISVYRFSRDRIMEGATSWDQYGVLTKIGAVPELRERAVGQ